MVFGGGANGYVTARTMRFFGATEWRFAASVAAFCLPCYIAITLILVDFIEYFEKSDQLFPFTSIAFVSFFWVLCNVPASYLGAYRGFESNDDKPPCKVSAVRRPIPNQKWYIGEKFSIVICGFIIFSTVASELHYVVTSVWRSQIIGMFFFSFLTLNLLVCVVALISVLHTYAALANQNWQWWWRSFFSGFSAALWMFVYAVWLMSAVFKMDVFWSDVVFLLYAVMMSTCFGLMCGAVSVLASWLFVTYLYALSKSE